MDHELLFAKFKLKLKKAGKTTRPECLKNYGWRFITLYRRQ